ncbi:DUF1705 domain-containing protein [Pararhizobium sp. LjRoot255]|uniref:phosphoethanolamine transferase domain-containing protein n=1 Tax=Pararhizobium sp. LjRoot255 TaxID=3342298 RepID=UPI003ECFCC85
MTCLVLLCIGLAALFSALCIAVSVKYLTKPLFILLITSAATASWFMDRYGTIIDLDMIRNAAETTGSEAGHLMTAGFLTHITVFALQIGRQSCVCETTVHAPFELSAGF